MSDVIERFLRYIKIDTKSSEESGLHPSTDIQFNLAKVLIEDLKAIGVSNINFDEEHCYIYAKLPGNDLRVKETIGFIAHMDTSPEAAGDNVNPRFVENYDGRDIVLNESENIVLSPEQFPELNNYKGQTLIVTDGKTLLGSDDKSGISEIMSMLKYLIDNPDIKHGPIAVAFTPDEEIGEGTEYFDIEKFGADYAYTIDGGQIGEISYENFNAAGVTVEVTGRNVHPGEAYMKMVNAMKLAMDFNSRLPADMCPEKTKDYEGFFHLISIEGDASKTIMKFLIRDHSRELFEEKKNLIQKIADEMNDAFDNRIKVTIKDSYFNMREKIVPDNMFLVNYACRAMETVGINPIISPIRGGTDGATLSFKGLPCPNLCAGGHNFHGVYEYVPVESMERITELLIKLAQWSSIEEGEDEE